ncbi:uncharacterized protein LOC142525453 [Primulina tabacum]|uniref:uncharacterized protein LOC142525453 n=1 Tax=Primulina tabacum TaxID=48773 RepID=UPI003F5AC30C
MSTTTENFMQSETITLEHASSGAFSQIPPKTPNRNSGDVDFNDVFGGPPRRYSTQEARVRYSFGEIVASEDDGSSSPWNGRKEKPVFRIDNMGRNRYPSDDFFDDIFRGDECYGSPRSFDRDSVIASSPSLRITSPVSKPEFFGTSLPPDQLSLTSKSTTARFSPHVPQNHGLFKMDGTANQLNSSRSSSSSSRIYRRSPLASFSSEDSSSTVKGVAENSSANLGRSGVKGKVKEFVQNFNHEADSMPKLDIPIRSHSHRWKCAGIDQKDNEVNVNESKVKENVESNDEEKKPDVSLKVEKNMNKDDARLKPQTKNPSFRKSFRGDSKVSVENSDDPFEDYFSVQELSPCHETVAQRDEVSEEMKAIDAKIRQWAVGKNGNIRSLLSTLQFVLWPGNEWKPVALVDLIETNAVKRAYQKALLRLHPDKLQQNSAASNKKYIAEKVFDLLQEAWDHFNTLAPL